MNFKSISKSKIPVSKAKTKSKVISKAKTKSKVSPSKAKISKGKSKNNVSNTAQKIQVSDPDHVDDDLEQDETAGKKSRVKPTIYDHIAHYNQLLELLKGEIDKKSRSKENGVRSLQRARKMVETMRKELPHVTRSKEARAALSTRKNTPSGFTMQYYVSEELAKFLQIDPNVDTVSRVDVMRAISVYVNLKQDEKREKNLEWAYLNADGKRNLQNPEDKKTIILDKTLATLFKSKPGNIIGYNSIQGFIGQHFLSKVVNEEQKEKEDENVEEETEENEDEIDDNTEGY